MWRNHPEYLKKQYWKKRVLWSGSYFIASCGGVTIEQLRKYVEQQQRQSAACQTIARQFLLVIHRCDESGDESRRKLKQGINSGCLLKDVNCFDFKS